MQSSQKPNPGNEACLTHRIDWFYDGFAADRSLAKLVSGYRDFARFQDPIACEWRRVPCSKG